MPGLVSHNHLAERVLNSFSCAIKKDLLPEFFFVGAQGGDIFFGGVLDNGQNLAKVLHYSNPRLMLESVAKYLKNNNDKELFSYILGYICHYALDKVLHPYVIFMAENDLKDIFPDKMYAVSSRHLRFETDIDSYLLQNVYNQVPTFFNNKEILNKIKKTYPQVAYFYSSLIFPIYNLELSQKKILRIINMYNLFYRLTDSRNGVKRNIIKGLERLVGIKHIVYNYYRVDDIRKFNPSYKISENVMKLFDVSEKLALKLSCQFCNNINTNEKLTMFSQNFKGLIPEVNKNIKSANKLHNRNSKEKIKKTIFINAKK